MIFFMAFAEVMKKEGEMQQILTLDLSVHFP
jgi:hypothetical protein